MKLAVVVQRYGADINGGAELHARYIAERLARHADGRGRHDLRARLRDVEERAAAGRRAGQRHHRPPLSRRARAQARTTSAGGRVRVFDKPHSIADELALARQRRTGEPGAGELRRARRAGARLRPALQLSLLPRVAPGAADSGEGGDRADRGARSGDRPVDLRPGLPRRARRSCTTRRKSAR